MRMTLAVLAACFAVPAYAQQCADMEVVEDMLRGQYGETVQSHGYDSRGTVMTVWANTVTGTWTVTASNAAGLTCVIGAGEMFQAVNEPQGVDG
jgi:hypothetical protein